MGIKKTSRGWIALCLAGTSMALGALSGCQTHVAGMTLPSGWYLQHPPQYIPPTPPFPLSREAARMEDINAAPVPGGGAAPLPPPIPGGAP
jgi:hypothetical protein